MIRSRKEEKNTQNASQAVAQGFASGFTGLFSKPAEGAQKDGAKGFFKGLAQGLGGFIAKPVVGMLDGFSNATASAARVAADDIDPELDAAVADARYSLDGYLRLVWYHHIRKVPVSQNPSNRTNSSSFASSAEAFDEKDSASLNRGASRAGLFGRSRLGSDVPSGASASNLSASETAQSRILNRLSEQLLLSCKFNFNTAAILCSNFRLKIAPIPSEFAREIPPQLVELSKEKSKRSPIISTRTVSSLGISEQIESQSLLIWLGPQHGTRSLEFRSDDADDSLVIQCVCVAYEEEREQVVESRWSHRVVCESVQEARDLAQLLKSFTAQLPKLYA
jgi:hypothetical protein